MLRRLALTLLLPIVALPLAAAEGAGRRPLALEDLFKMQRLSDPALSPDGRWVAYTVATPNLEKNENSTDLWLTPAADGPARQLTTHSAKDGHAAWSPDGRTIAFESTRSDDAQIWLISLEGGEARQLTRISTEASQPVWSPDGKSIAFVSAVFPENSAKPFLESDALNKKKIDEMENGKVKAKVFDRLFFRHWDSWVDGKRQHIFIQSLSGAGPRDLTPGDRDAVPTSDTFSDSPDFAFSPDGKEIAFTAPPEKNEAWSTNYDIYVVPVAGGAPRAVTTNPAADGAPRYSPDGKYIAYRAQAVAGFEADRWQLMLYDRAAGSSRSLTTGLDASVESVAWSPDSRRLYFQAQEQGSVALFTISTAGNDAKKILGGGASRGVSVSADGRRVVFRRDSAARAPELYAMSAEGGDPAPITHANDDLFAALDVPAPESVWYAGDGGRRVQAWLFKPPKFDPARKYPLVYLVHGGPQSAWLDSWSFRWNPALWAAQGYVILAPNPRGSTGFGQQFTNEISRDWGGKVFADLMKGLDYAEALPYVDRANKAAAGASYGGYMMNWFQAKAGGRFKTLVTHCGVFNAASMYGTTEELWFEEWEHGGTPWDNQKGYEEFSPQRYAKNFNTPNLIIHNASDFRVPLSEGLQLFTTLQRRGVPSKMLYFPDEGHWVLKPANSRLWHETVFDWLAQYLKPDRPR
jgi:dipeptidyl aminopeptidase/acylaminoacyl peptidase